MWFGFSLLIFVSISIYSFYKSFLQPRPNFDKNIKNIPYCIKTISESSENSRKEVGFEVSIQIPKEFSFQFKRETFIDRFFKRIKLSHEFQTNNNDFDKTIYLSSDNSAFHNLLKNNIEIQNLILSIFKIGPRWSHSVKRVRALKGVLTLTYKDSNTWSSNDKQNIVESSVLSLEQLVSSLLSKSTNNMQSYKDPFLNRFLIFSCINFTLITLGYSSYLRYGFSGSIPFTVDKSDLITLSLICTLIVLFILSSILVKSLKKSSRTHLLLLELISIGGICLFITLSNEIRLYNQLTDDSKAVKFTSEVIDKYITSRRKAGTSYNIRIKSWERGISSTSIQVNRDEYNSITLNDTVNIFQKNGTLNFRWVENLEFIPNQNRKSNNKTDSHAEKGETQYNFDFTEINKELESRRIYY